MHAVTESPNRTVVKLQMEWVARVDRARNLELRHDVAQDVLRFYRHVLEFQQKVAASLQTVSQPVVELRAQLNTCSALEHLDGLLSLTVQRGPAVLAARAKELQRFERFQRTKIFEAFISNSKTQDDSEDFFLRAILQPIAEASQKHVEVPAPTFGAVCPVCGGLPQLSTLRPEGDGGARWLQCSFCLHEWLFRRVVCPWCDEENKEKLPRFTAEQCAHVQVSACDTCKRYLKSVDMTIDGLAVPLVDEVAMVALDVWAVEQGFKKICLNLMGF